MHEDRSDPARARDRRRRVLVHSVVVVLAVGAMAVLGLADPAGASLKFCNDTGARVTVAVAYVEKDPPGVSTNGHRGVTVRGWYKFDPSECAAVSDIDSAKHWVYYYAHGDGGEWAGTSWLCVGSRKLDRVTSFHRSGDRCPQGDRLVGFKRIDAHKPNYTMRLKP
jgi:uncharacterized membrane protein